MDWQAKGVYGMIKEPFRIAKHIVNGRIKYGLWKDYEHLGYFDSFDEAKDVANKEEKKK